MVRVEQLWFVGRIICAHCADVFFSNFNVERRSCRDALLS